MAIVVGINGYTISIIVVGAAIYLLGRVLAGKRDSQEPPVLRSRIPFVGHIFGMIWHQSRYFKHILPDKNTPAFTLDMPGSKIYVITSPTLGQSAMRSKNLAFEPFIILVAERMVRVSQEGLRIIKTQPEDPKAPSYMRDLHNAMHASMRPGAGLLEMNVRVLDKLAAYANNIGNEWETQDLFLWLRDSFTFAVSRSLYGAHNPVEKDPSLVDHIWAFDADNLWLMANILPSTLAPKGYRARDVLQQAFQDYYAAGHDKDASALMQGRNAAARKWGISEYDIAQFEFTILFVATTNAMPSVFWLLCYILADPQLLHDIRSEVLAVTEFNDGEAKIDVTRLGSECPLLSSAYNESLRLTSVQVAARFVMEDTMIKDSATGKSYLLKKGNFAQLPSSLQHNSTQIWGPDAATFDARRFIRRETAEKETKKLQTQGFIPFGGGKNLCPGRFFALAEILGMVSVLALGFEFVGDDDGVVRLPETKPEVFGTAVLKPLRPLGVKVRRRQQYENTRWAFKAGKGLDEAAETVVKE